MTTIRRLYIYLVAAAGLGLLIAGMSGAGGTVLELLLGSGAVEATYRQSISLFGAEIIVALPLWLLHWRWAQRIAHRDPLERTATLRRLYLYAMLGALLINLGILGYNLIGAVLDLALSPLSATGSRDAIGPLRTLWELAVAAAFWASTFRIAGADRAAAGEAGASATLRRWYAYGAQLVALLFALFGAQALLQTLLLTLFDRTSTVGMSMTADSGISGDVAMTLIGLAVWVFHRRWTARAPFAVDDRTSTLRAVYGFGIVAVAVAITLLDAGRILYWSLARLLGVPSLAQLPGDAVTALAGPAASVVIFAAAWALTRRDLERSHRDAGAEAARQSDVRRLYTHLVALVALAAFASGAVMLLWALVEQVTGPAVATPASDFRDQVSRSVTLLVVGLAVWRLYWRAAPAAADRLAVSRRLYLFAALLGGVLTGLGSGIWLASQLLSLLLGAGSPAPLEAIGRALSLLLVAVAVVLYHARVLWADLSLQTARNQAAAPTPPPAVAAGPVVVEIDGATAEEVRLALAALPATATYELRLS